MKWFYWLNGTRPESQSTVMLKRTPRCDGEQGVCERGADLKSAVTLSMHVCINKHCVESSWSDSLCLYISDKLIWTVWSWNQFRCRTDRWWRVSCIQSFRVINKTDRSESCYKGSVRICVWIIIHKVKYEKLTGAAAQRIIYSIGSDVSSAFKTILGEKLQHLKREIKLQTRLYHIKNKNPGEGFLPRSHHFVMFVVYPPWIHWRHAAARFSSQFSNFSPLIILPHYPSCEERGSGMSS